MAESKKDTTVEMPAENPSEKAFDMEAFRAELKAELLAEMSDAPRQISSQPVYIAKPVTEEEAVETARLAKQEKDRKESEAWLNEPVTFRLFKDGKEYKDPLYVSINGENVHIQRGIDVTLKRKYVMQIEESFIQSIKAAEYADEQQEAYKEAVKVLE